MTDKSESVNEFGETKERELIRRMFNYIETNSISDHWLTAKLRGAAIEYLNTPRPECGTLQPYSDDVSRRTWLGDTSGQINAARQCADAHGISAQGASAGLIPAPAAPTPRTLARDLRHGSWTAQIDEMLSEAADCIERLERELAEANENVSLHVRHYERMKAAAARSANGPECGQINAAPQAAEHASGDSGLTGSGPAVAAPTPRTDTLVERLRSLQDMLGRKPEFPYADMLADESADRIERLERELADMTAARDRTADLLREAIEENTKLRREVEEATMERNDEFLEAMNLLGVKDGETLLDLAHRLTAVSASGSLSDDDLNALALETIYSLPAPMLPSHRETSIELLKKALRRASRSANGPECGQINAAPQVANEPPFTGTGDKPPAPAVAAPTPRTDAVLASQPNGGFGLEKKQCIAQWYDHARQLEGKLADMTAARDRTADLLREAIEENTRFRGQLADMTINPDYSEARSASGSMPQESECQRVLRLIATTPTTHQGKWIENCAAVFQQMAKTALEKAAPTMPAMATSGDAVEQPCSANSPATAGTTLGAALSTSGARTSAWLIEYGGTGGKPLWWGRTVGYIMEWTDDANKAIRFSRREDAEAAMALLDQSPPPKATEHIWMEPITVSASGARS